MLEAYKVHSILKQGVQIESIAAYDDNVILGTRSGQLIMYSVSESGAVDMLMFNKMFSKKAISQMEVITSENLLFVLTDNIIHVCDINRRENNFSLIQSYHMTKGCTLFTLDVKTNKSNSGETSTAIRVCCAIKRQLHFFDWELDTLKSPQFSIEIKDVPKALCLVDDIVCVGFKDEYVIYNIHSNKPEKHNLKVTFSSQSFDPRICLLNHNILGASKDTFLFTIDPADFTKREDDKNPTQGSLDPSASVNNSTKSTFKPILWSSPLMNFVWDEPYAVGRVANAIEVRSFATGINKETLVQTLPELAKTKFLVRSGKGKIFAAAVSELWYIRLADIPVQRQQMLQQKRFQLAIELTNISDEPELIKLETIRTIHMRHGRELFASKQFEAAMNEFQKAASDPYDVIRLFPNLLQDQNKPTSSNESDVAVPKVPLPQLEDNDLENALIALINFLALARQKEVVKLRDAKSTSKSLLSIIDTTLLKCYLQTNESLIAPLLRLNQCHFEESEKMLKKHDKISELIILYQTNGKHKKALDLLKAQATMEGSILHGYDRTIRYLQALGAANLPLTFEFADWVLKAQPEDGLRIFTESLIEVENLPRASVLDFLLSKHKHLVIPYLEHVIYEWKDSNAFLNDMLIKKYLEKVQQLMEELQGSTIFEDENRENEKELQIYRTKLYEILKNSKNYSPEAVLKDFPTNILLEERVLILGCLKEHEKVIAIYIKVLGDVDKACEYCENNYENDNEIFLTLLKTILKPLEQPPIEGVDLHPNFKEPNLDVAIKLLDKYALKIDPDILWPYLPQDLPIHRLAHYLDVVLRHQLAERNQAAVMEGLLTAEISRYRDLIRQFQNLKVEITEFTVCPDCKKRFANQTAFVRYPNGEVVHLSCHDKRVQQQTNT